MAGFAGICGTSGRRCKLVWSNTFLTRTQVGTYPSELLPSRRTIWHASAGGGYNYNPAGTALGGTGSGGSISGLGLVDSFAGFGLYGSDVQIDFFRPKSQVVVIFARTQNRINIPHVLTRAEIESADPVSGTIEINLGEYVFEAIAVTDTQEIVGDIWKEIQDATNDADILEDDYGQSEEAEDRNFRKLIEATNSIPEESQRLEGIVSNKLGIEYRLDNGGPKSTAIFGERTKPNYRDGSTRKITMNVVFSRDAEGNLENTLKPGTVVYLTYVAIKEHYIRQVLHVSWVFSAQSLPPQCYAMAIAIRAANYRFYEWEVENDDPQGLPILLGGWRAVESFGCPVNIAALVPPYDDSNIAMFGYGSADGPTRMSYLPIGVTENNLNAFIDNRSTLPYYTLVFNERDVEGATYIIPADDEYKKSSWYLGGTVPRLRRGWDIDRHAFFNVHPKALKKRDVDKFAIERSLAETLETEAKAGKKTFFPFWDGVDDLVEGEINFLDASNTRFEPIQPVQAGWFGEMQCGSVGGSVLFPAGGPSPSGDVVAFFQMESPIITEKFAKETRVLVERHFTTGQVNPAIVAIEGAAGSVAGLSCIGDPSDHFAYTVHSNEGFLHINDFQNGYVAQGMRALTYRPDKPPLLTADNLNPVPTDYERYVGFSGMLGDKHGYKPGRYLSLSAYAPREAFIYKSTAKDNLARSRGLDVEEIEDLVVEHKDNMISIDLNGHGFYGITEIEYLYHGTKHVETLMRLKNGESLSGVVDEVDVPIGHHVLKLDHRWMQGSKIELVDIPQDKFKLIRVTVMQLADSYAEDMLRNETSSSPEAADTLIKRLEDRSVLVETDIMSVGEDSHSRLFVFFNDKDNGISCLESDDFGINWSFHYGIIEQISNLTSLNPFVLQSFERNKAWVFYQFMGGKIMCKQIDYPLFNVDDANLIERTSDVLQEATNQASTKETLGLKEDETALIELPSIYTEDGVQLRRKTTSYVVAGDLTDEEFLRLTGRDLEGKEYDPFQKRLKTNPAGGSDLIIVDYRYPVAIGSNTAFTNKDIEDIHFSAYRKVNGEMKLFFMAPTKPNGDFMLQARFSNDNGINWYDLWEYIEFGFDRLRFDRERKTQFIDTSSDGGRGSMSGTDPTEGSQDAEFGINLHWSRLKKHKIEGDDNLNVESDSEVLPVSAPYAFYHHDTDSVFLFYIYEGCLLCKHFADHAFKQAASNKEATGGGIDETPMGGLKKFLERRLRADFIDGELKNIKEEVHYLYNEDTEERLLEGNIVFPYPQTVDTFDDNRRISTQRVCAYALRNGNVRVFYKNVGGELKAALWDGRTWMPEDLMRNDSKLEPFDFESWEGANGVVGGFSDEKFSGSAGHRSGAVGGPSSGAGA